MAEQVTQVVPPGFFLSPNDDVQDCRSETGITVGLVDSIITACRVLARRDLTDPQVREALTDLRGDEDLATVLGQR